MKNVLVVCAAGMTSGVLVTYLREHIKKHPELEYKVGSCASNQIVTYIAGADIVLMSPHLGYMTEDLKKRYPEKKFYLISAEAYADMNMDVIVSEMEHQQSPETYQPKNRLIEKLSSFANTSKVLASLSSAMSSLMSVIIVGSVFTLALNFPVPAVTGMIEGTLLKEILELGINVTINMMSVYAVFMIGYYYAEYFDVSCPHAGVNALICFLMIICSPFTDIPGGLIDLTYLGARGMFCAIFTAIISVRVYASMQQLGRKVFENLRSVPEGIYQSFVAFLPTMFSMIVFLIITSVFGYLVHLSFPEWVYTTLQGRIGTFAGESIMVQFVFTLMSHLLWFVGIHGGSVIGSVTNPIMLPLSLENIAAYQAGKQLPHIINSQFRQAYMFGGAGSTLSLCVLMVFAAKSHRMKSLGKAALPMGIFFINEPILFGLPVILNPLMLFPFILIPVSSMSLTWLLMKMGILPYVTGFEIPWTTPPLISGMIQGGWKLALWQVILMVIQAALWFPFFRVQDRKYLKEENSGNLPGGAA